MVLFLNIGGILDDYCGGGEEEEEEETSTPPATSGGYGSSGGSGGSPGDSGGSSDSGDSGDSGGSGEVESPSSQKPYRIIQSKQSEHSIVEPDDTLGSGYISGCVLANVSSQGTGSALDVIASDNGKRYLLTEETEWGSTPEKEINIIIIYM